MFAVYRSIEINANYLITCACPLLWLQLCVLYMRVEFKRNRYRYGSV